MTIFFYLLKDELSSLFNNITFMKKQPTSHTNAIVNLLFKKGGHRNHKNRRPVNLLNMDYKIFSKLLTNRITKVGAYQIKLYQMNKKWGIRNRKITDVIRNLVTYRDYSESRYFILLDQAKAFDRVNHKYLFTTTEAFGIQGDFLEPTKAIYSDITSQIVVNGQPTEKIQIERGVRQRLSPQYSMC